MELRQLRYLLAVARAGSFSRASTELHMTQPPLSAAIAQLEQELGSRLFKRTSRGVLLTDSGREVVRQAEQLLAQEREIRRRVAAIEGGIIGTLELGCTPPLVSSHLPDVLRLLTREMARLDVSFQEADPITVIDLLMTERLDAGLVATASTEDLRTLYGPTLTADFLGEAEMVVALPPDEADRPEVVSLHDLADREFAVPARSMRHGLRVALLAAFDRAGLPPPLLRDVPDIQDSLPLVTAGAVVTVLPEGFRSLVHPDRVAFRRLADGPVPLEISALFRTDRADQPPIRRFREAARTVSGLPEA